MTENYEKSDGTPCTLEWLVRNEPEWAASRIRVGAAAISERDAALAEVERLKVFETAVVAYAISVFEFETAEIGQDGDQRMEMDAAERALLALVPKDPTP